MRIMWYMYCTHLVSIRNNYIILHYRSKLWYHLIFDDYLNYLNYNSVSDKICSFNELNAIKIHYKMSS